MTKLSPNDSLSPIATKEITVLPKKNETITHKNNYLSATSCSVSLLTWADSLLLVADY